MKMVSYLVSEGYRKIAVSEMFSELTNVSSIISIFQVVDIELMKNMKENLLDEKQELMIDSANLNLKQAIYMKYALLFRRLESLSKMIFSNGKLPKCVKTFVVGLIELCENYLDSLPDRTEENYSFFYKKNQSIWYSFLLKRNDLFASHPKAKTKRRSSLAIR